MRKNLLSLLSGVTFALLLATMLALPPVAHAQTFNVIYNFTDGADGGSPETGLTMISPGNFYGTTYHDYGTVFKLKYANSAWTLTTLYTFQGGNDGAGPGSPVLIAPNGVLYGTTFGGGPCTLIFGGCGTVYSLRPSPKLINAVSSWTETQLYSFMDGADGAQPIGSLTIDQAGNVYGTASAGGDCCNCNGGFLPCGTAWEVTPSNGGWTQSVIHTFTGGDDGGVPSGGLISDSAGNLYGTAELGGAHGWGVAFQLTPSGSAWTENPLWAFEGGNDGGLPYAGLFLSPAGDLFGSTFDFGSGGSGTVFELTPSMGSWTYAQIYALNGPPGGGPGAPLSMDQNGSLYGTTNAGGQHGYGSVFKLTYADGVWSYTSLHDFTGGADGGFPQSNVSIDSSGNLLGTASAGGSASAGVIWEITPN